MSITEVSRMVDVLLDTSRSLILIRPKAELNKTEERKYLLLPAELEVVDAAPGWNRMEFALA